jgi:transcriptional regulator with XRE-family HTH domain
MKPIKLTFSRIQELLSEKNILLADIADALKVSRTHVSLIARGESTSNRVANAIALSLDLPINQIFGDKYERNHNPSERATRKQQVIKAIRAGQPVPPQSNMA